MDAVDAGRFESVQVDQRVVVEDLRVMGGDEPHPPHVGRERVDSSSTPRVA